MAAQSLVHNTFPHPAQTGWETPTQGINFFQLQPEILDHSKIFQISDFMLPHKQNYVEFALH